MSKVIFTILILLSLNNCKQIKDDAKKDVTDSQPTQDNETPDLT